jgi:excisionase family DNA binding protein
MASTKHPRSVPPDGPNMSIADVAIYLGITEKTVRNMISDGRLPAYQCGTRVIRLRRAEIDAAMAPYRDESA